MAAGSASCPCSSTALFNLTAGKPPLVLGDYRIEASFSGEHHLSSSISQEFTVTGDLPSAAAAAIPISMLALALLFRRGRRRDAAPEAQSIK